MNEQDDLYSQERAGDYPPDRPPQQRPPGMQLIDRRKPDRIMLPFYVIERYGGELGTNGIAVYCGLCYHCARVRIAWPSYATLARELGCSRSTIERTMRLLKALGLVIVEPYFEGKRQTSNVIYLVDPGTNPGDLRNPPVKPVGDPFLPPAPPPSKRGTEVDPEEVDPEGGSAPPPDASLQHKTEIRYLRDKWMSLLSCAAPRLRSEHKAEIVVEVGELLRRGYTAVHLEREMDAQERDRAEWPRRFRERIGRAKPPKQARQGAPSVDLDQRAAEEAAAAQAAKKLREAGGFAVLARRQARGESIKTVFEGFELPVAGN